MQNHNEGASDLWTPCSSCTYNTTKQIFFFQILSMVRIFPLVVIQVKKCYFCGNLKPPNTFPWKLLKISTRKNLLKRFYLKHTTHSWYLAHSTFSLHFDLDRINKIKERHQNLHLPIMNSTNKCNIPMNSIPIPVQILCHIGLF